MLQQHWRFEEYEWGMVLDDVRLRPVLHVVVVEALLLVIGVDVVHKPLIAGLEGGAASSARHPGRRRSAKSQAQSGDK